jgi:hypothetical protein
MTASFRLEDFFPGRSQAYGIFQDRFGRPRRQLRADIEGTIEDGILTLDERFTFDDGAKEKRIWKIEPQGGGHYRATANGVIGVAIGEPASAALRWRYTFALDIGSRTLAVQFDDWMCRQSETVLINRAVVKKWGVRIGDLTLVFIKRQGSL